VAYILFLTQVLPYPLNAGPKVRAYHMLRHLAERHQVTLVSFVRPDDTPDAIQHLQGICQAVHTVPMRRSLWLNFRAGARSLLTGLPVVIARDEIGQMESLLRQLTRQTHFDVVHADQLSMAAYGRLAAHHGASRTLLDEHNAFYLLTRQMAAAETRRLRRAIMAREARTFARYEAAMCRAFNAVLTVTQEDRGRLLALYSPERRAALLDKFTVVPICIDPEQTPPVMHQPRADGRPTILHLGTMFWPPNVEGVMWFAREVLPLIHKRCSEAHFVVVGKSPPLEVQALASDPRIEVTGYVADPKPYLAQADAFVVPLQVGEGMRVKILDAWLWGMPIVSTPIGAEGVETQDKENILIASDAPAFASATLRLLTDPALNQRLRNTGRAWVETRYAWRMVYQRVDQVYDRLLGTNGDSSTRVSEHSVRIA
jgi:glycosyltransferase involved in cell wall biosynthesis